MEFPWAIPPAWKYESPDAKPVGLPVVKVLLKAWSEPL